MTADIIQFPGETTISLAPKQVLHGAIDADLDEVLVLGQKDGKEQFFGSSSEMTFNNWLCDKFKKFAMDLP